MKSLNLDYTYKTLNHHEINISDYSSSLLLIVNVASHCGFTYQYRDLESLYREFSPKLTIIGFPCDQFGNQEFDSESDIQHFCQKNFGVTFPVTHKVKVNGKNQDLLFGQLKKEMPGFLGSKVIKWNFTKFLINKSIPFKRYSPKTEISVIRKDIQELIHNQKS